MARPLVSPAAPSASSRQPATAEEITSSALWHLFDYDLENQLFTLMRIEEEVYRATSFLDHRLTQYQCPVVNYELRNLAGMFPRMREKRRPLRFIFHIGHCGSTLLSRALAVTRRVLPFREPMTLRSLSADQRELKTPFSLLAEKDWHWLLTTMLDTLARSFRSDQVNVVKATSTGNNLIGPILDEHPDHRAVLMYIPLESYLATMLANSGSGGDLKGQARTRMRDWLNITGETDLAIHKLGNARLAALSWLTSMNYILEALAREPDRLLMLDFEAFLEDPEEHLTSAAAFLGLDHECAEIVEGYDKVSGSYSKKPDAPFGRDQRAQHLNRARQEKADEIASTIDWAGSMVEPVPHLEHLARYFE